ncbi:hypothetical protein KW798_02015 [Candidatus Parcubacteria bacterium]|nr:hypothetical protein [Candidatus Parcubacteria bacterium]
MSIVLKIFLMAILLVDVSVGSFYVGRKYEQMAVLQPPTSDSPSIVGTLTAKTANSISIHTAEDETKTFTVSSSTKVTLTNTIASHILLRKGLQLVISLSPNGEADSITATSIDVLTDKIAPGIVPGLTPQQ